MSLSSMRLAAYAVSACCLVGSVFAFASAEAERPRGHVAGADREKPPVSVERRTKRRRNRAPQLPAGARQKGGRNAARPVARSSERPSSTPGELLVGFNPLEHRLQGGTFVADLADGRTAELSLDPELQQHVQDVLRRFQVPYGAVAALDPTTGRMLAYVSHSSAQSGARDLLRDATPPAASVFKLITTAALLESGVEASSRVCYGGGLRRIDARDLRDDPRRDRACVSLADALGRSVNTVFAKLADRRLNRTGLRRYTEAFGFGHTLPFDAAIQPGRAELPKGRLEFARTAAGFWHTHMSPLHAALISATIANRGVMPRATMVRRILDRNGLELYRHRSRKFRSVIAASTAKVLGRMMERTVTSGTARKAFFDDGGRAFLPGIRVAGKTGSLSTDRPYRAYSWWVGFAPADKPKIAVAALVINDPKWRIKGSYLARETLREYLVARPRRAASGSVATR